MEQAAVTVHFVTTNWNQAMGRFIGPVALFDRAKELLLELKAIGTSRSEWRGWVDLLEGSGALKPALRWRVPSAALARLWAQYDEREPEGRHRLTLRSRWSPPCVGSTMRKPCGAA